MNFKYYFNFFELFFVFVLKKKPIKSAYKNSFQNEFLLFGAIIFNPTNNFKSSK
jgi:hypothetical protein